MIRAKIIRLLPREEAEDATLESFIERNYEKIGKNQSILLIQPGSLHLSELSSLADRRVDSMKQVFPRGNQRMPRLGINFALTYDQPTHPMLLVFGFPWYFSDTRDVPQL